MTNISNKQLEDILNNINGQNIAVVGDVMLDRYFWGSVTRVSPEAPVPVIDLENETFHLGGAANVAANLSSLGIKPILCGVLGNDNSAKAFKNICKTLKINSSGLYLDSERSTTVKTRIIGNNQQIVRLDREDKKNINSKGEAHIINTLKNCKGLKAIVLSDYNKGVLSKKLINRIISYANNNNILVLVDPKFDNFFEYKNVFLMKPNKKEASNACGKSLNNEKEIVKCGKDLKNKLKCNYLLLTLSSEGMLLFKDHNNTVSIGTKARHIADVSGAGDTVIASLASCVVAGASIEEASTIANYAAGYVCGEPGIVSITKENILNYIK